VAQRRFGDTPCCGAPWKTVSGNISTHAHRALYETAIVVRSSRQDDRVIARGTVSAARKRVCSIALLSCTRLANEDEDMTGNQMPP
jgi:hypothetical protein